MKTSSEIMRLHCVHVCMCACVHVTNYHYYHYHHYLPSPTYHCSALLLPAHQLALPACITSLHYQHAFITSMHTRLRESSGGPPSLPSCVMTRKSISRPGVATSTCLSTCVCSRRVVTAVCVVAQQRVTVQYGHVTSFHLVCVCKLVKLVMQCKLAGGS